MSLTYDDTVKLLTSPMKFKINLGLERISEVLKIFGNPQNKFKFIHVAGTNGKGSVCAILENILRVAGYKTGLYTSPHLVRYTECIKIDGSEISKEDFSGYVEKVCIEAEKNGTGLTEFEILTAAAFLFFADKKVDFAIVETGLGGRYDATNVCQSPFLTIITSVSLDHTDRLGNTVEKIAYEKAGIIKAGVPLVVAKDNAGYNVISGVAEEYDSKILIPEDEITVNYKDEKNILKTGSKEYEFALRGSFQKYNAELVFKAVEYLRSKGYKIEEDAVKNALKTVKHPARAQYIKEKNLLIDGAHNPSAARELRKTLDTYFKGQKRIYIYGTINTKDYVKISEILFDKNDEIYYREFAHKDAVGFEEYKSKTGLNNVYKLSELEDLFEKDGLKIATGSFYMLGEIYPGLI